MIGPEGRLTGIIDDLSSSYLPEEWGTQDEPDDHMGWGESHPREQHDIVEKHGEVLLQLQAWQGIPSKHVERRQLNRPDAQVDVIPPCRRETSKVHDQVDLRQNVEQFKEEESCHAPRPALLTDHCPS